MAEVVQPLQNAPHGTKRAAETSLEHEQRLSKRFDLLNLADDNGTRLYIGIPGSNPPANTTHGTRGGAADSASAMMAIDETPHRVYIHDLAAELQELSSDEDTPIFLPDIEKHLSKIPRHLLRPPELKPTDDNQLVLYNEPASLSVPAEQDNVRKAIVEARQRIREKQGGGGGSSSSSGNSSVVDAAPHLERRPMAVQTFPVTDDDDGDAMDID